MNFKVYGQKNLRKAIQGSISVMSHLAKLIQQSDNFELITNNLSVVCFRYIGSWNESDLGTINRLNYHLVKTSQKDKRIFIRDTKLNGMVVRRACCTNFRREPKHVEYFLDVLEELGQQLI